ncbi:MAG TPA: V-type ATP synthase subunit B, partial [Thermoanaerobaculia bacterium]
MTTAGLERRGLTELRGSLAFIEGVEGVAFHEFVDLVGSDGETRPARVLSTTERGAIVEVFGVTDGLKLETSRVRFHGRPMRFGVGPELLGRVFDGLGRPRDALPPPACVERRPIGGSPINPTRRAYP